MKVIRIPLRFLRNDEFNIYLKKVVDIILLHNPNTVSIIEDRRKALGDFIPLINIALGIDRKSPLTDKIIEEDHIRDGYISGIRKVAEGYTTHFKPEVVAAAQIVSRAIGKHGEIEGRSHVEETGVLEILIKETKATGMLHDAILLLKIDDWFTALAVSNQKVFDLHAQRTAEKTPDSEANVLELRGEAIGVYTKLMANIDSAANLDNSGAYNKLIDTLNTLAAEAKTILEMRKSGNIKPIGDK